MQVGAVFEGSVIDDPQRRGKSHSSQGPIICRRGSTMTIASTKLFHFHVVISTKIYNIYKKIEHTKQVRVDESPIKSLRLNAFTPMYVTNLQ